MDLFEMSDKKWLEKVKLTGNLVSLLPLQLNHKNELLAASKDGDLSDIWFTSVPSELTINNYLDIAEIEFRENRSLPFVVVENNTGQIIGSTRFCNISVPDKRLEIGYTWYAKSFQRTGVNTECKYLLLNHAFESLNCIAVEFRTHWHNHKSQNAILRLGAKQDGVLRNHKIDQQGLLRDTVVFSILNSEWPTVKKSLLFKMNSYEVPHQ